MTQDPNVTYFIPDLRLLAEVSYVGDFFYFSEGDI
jgi:hypothetical protein